MKIIYSPRYQIDIGAHVFPTLKYRMAHPEAKLTEQETRELSRGLDAMLRPPGQR